MTQATHDCTACPVSAGTHKPADAVHLISEPAAALVATCDSATNLSAPAHPAEGVSAPVAVGMREAFEAWARDYGTWEVQRDDDSDLGTTGYTDVSLTVAWHAVQASAALAATPAAPAPSDEAIIAWAMEQQADPIKALRASGFVRVARAVLARWAAGVPAAAPDARIQWWLATLDQYGNPTLTDGAHSSRAGADKAAYLIDAMGLGRGKKYAIARVELNESTPSAEGVNHEAVALHNRAAIAAQAGKGVQ